MKVRFFVVVAAVLFATVSAQAQVAQYHSRHWDVTIPIGNQQYYAPQYYAPPAYYVPVPQPQYYVPAPITYYVVPQTQWQPLPSQWICDYRMDVYGRYHYYNCRWQ